jgi:Ribosome biogenesis protein SLX9
MKHSLLLSKARKSAGVSKTLKRRRPSKKLVTTLGELENALPDLEEQMVKAKTGQSSVTGFKSLGSKPGVRKKREKIEREERERFGKNLAVLSMAKPASGKAGGETSDTSNRWAALRAHLHTSMGEQGSATGG